MESESESESERERERERERVTYTCKSILGTIRDVHTCMIDVGKLRQTPLAKILHSDPLPRHLGLPASFRSTLNQTHFGGFQEYLEFPHTKQMALPRDDREGWFAIPPGVVAFTPVAPVAASSDMSRCHSGLSFVLRSTAVVPPQPSPPQNWSVLERRRFLPLRRCTPHAGLFAASHPNPVTMSIRLSSRRALRSLGL